jgi:hypothetical protein
MNAAGRWLIETALALASYFMGQPGRYSELRATFDCLIDTGPLSGLDRDAILKEVAAGVESEEGAMVRLGRTDPAKTKAQIASEKDAGAQRQQQALGAALLGFDKGQQGG